MPIMTNIVAGTRASGIDVRVAARTKEAVTVGMNAATGAMVIILAVDTIGAVAAHTMNAMTVDVGDVLVLRRGVHVDSALAASIANVDQGGVLAAKSVNVGIALIARTGNVGIVLATIGVKGRAIVSLQL